MSHKTIYAEVRKFITDKIANGETIEVAWLTHEIVSGKSLIEGEDCEFYRVCAYTHIKDVVKRCVGKYDAKPDTDRQLVLDGSSICRSPIRFLAMARSFLFLLIS